MITYKKLFSSTIARGEIFPDPSFTTSANLWDAIGSTTYFEDNLASDSFKNPSTVFVRESLSSVSDQKSFLNLSSAYITFNDPRLMALTIKLASVVLS